MNNKTWRITFFIIAIFFIGIRTWNFEKKLGFYLDQGIHLLESYEIVETGKLKMLGPKITSMNFEGRSFFIGPQYYWITAMLEIVLNKDPVLISLFYVLVELLSVVGLVIYIRKRFEKEESLLVFALWASSYYLTLQSRFFWNPDWLMPMGVAVFIFLDKFYKSGDKKYLFWCGLFWGLGFSFHYAASLWIIPILLVFIKTRKKMKWWWLIILAGGFFLGDLPFFVFEIRHNFYNIRTLFQIMTKGQSSTKEMHYFIYPLLIPMLFLTAKMLSMINKKRKVLLAMVILIIISGYQKLKINNYLPLGNDQNWNYELAQQTKEKILKNGCPENYNLATTVNGDTRFYEVRFLLTAEECKPMGVSDYPTAKRLFLVTPTKRRPEIETVWEVTAMRPFEIIREEKMDENTIFYELVRVNEKK